MKQFHSNYDEVVKTPIWEEEFQKLKLQNRNERLPLARISGHRYIKLQPGQEQEFNWFDLDYYNVLTEPDTYELTCFITSVIDGQYYETPLQSNTLTFRVLETPVADDYWLRDGVTQRGGEPQHIPYTNPPPGEEVFKQPKPPKNVFYVYTNTEILYPDVSPYTYYRQKAKEAEAANAEAEKQVEAE